MARATTEGTRALAERAEARGAVAPGTYRDVDGLAACSVGLGTYLGDAGDDTDLMYTEAVIEAVRLGSNVVDTAVNYRFQRSERAIGDALARLERDGVADRSEIVLTTKGGFVAWDGAPPPSRDAGLSYIEQTFLEPGVCARTDFTRNLQHCMAPGYLAHELARSLDNLGVDAVDVYYIHNPETQLPEVGRAEFDRRVRAAFELLEAKADEGTIGRYGTATWNGYRVEPSAAEYLSLERLVEIARDVGGEDHHFRAVQLPYNLAMPEAFAAFNQKVGDEWVSTLEAARRLGLSAFASASLMQSRLAGSLPDVVVEALGDLTNAQRALQFVRSTPGVTCALVGMARTAHVRENLALLASPPASAETIRGLFDEA
jgi:aryl-alcohol dehydrogenase-like predicted oxidoreductase